MPLFHGWPKADNLAPWMVFYAYKILIIYIHNRQIFKYIPFYSKKTIVTKKFKKYVLRKYLVVDNW